MTGIVSVNIKKIKATASVNRLLDENYRDEKTAEKYDDGHRVIRTDETGENVFLLRRPENYDRARRDRIRQINDARAARGAGPRVTNKAAIARGETTLQAERTRQAAGIRKLRADTVDTLGLVVQPSKDFIAGLTRDEQTRFFREALEVLQAHPDEFGQIDTAVIHYDENTPHMQCLSSTLNFDTLTADAKKICGNKSKLSNKQTILADGLKARGWDVDRGMKRVDNPAYQNWKTDMEARGYTVNRHNDRLLLQKQAELDAKAQEQLDRGIDLMDRDLKLVTAENDLTSRLRAVEAREAAVKAAEREIDLKRREMDSRAVRQRRTAQNQKQQAEALERREKAVEGREKAVGAAEGQLDLERREMDSRATRQRQTAQKQAERETALDARERQLSDWSGKLDQMQRHADAREQGLADREQGLNDREKRLKRGERDALKNIQDAAFGLWNAANDELEKRRQAADEALDARSFEAAVSALGQNLGDGISR